MFSVSNAEIKYERAGFYRNLRIGGGNLEKLGVNCKSRVVFAKYSS